MRERLVFVLVAVILLAGCASQAQAPVRAVPPRTCEGGVVATPEELAAYRGCTHVEGNLLVTVPSAADLRQLEALSVVRGMLGIFRCERLASLTGLERLRQVSDLALIGNPELASLEGLESLTQVGGLTLAKNRELRSLRGLEGVRRVDGLVLIDNGLHSLRGLEQLTVAGDLVIVDNARLIDVSALGHLRGVRSMTIRGNPAIAARLGWFEELERVTERVEVQRSAGVDRRDVASLRACRERAEARR